MGLLGIYPPIEEKSRRRDQSNFFIAPPFYGRCLLVYIRMHIIRNLPAGLIVRFLISVNAYLLICFVALSYEMRVAIIALILFAPIIEECIKFYLYKVALWNGRLVTLVAISYGIYEQLFRVTNLRYFPALLAEKNKLWLFAVLAISFHLLNSIVAINVARKFSVKVSMLACVALHYLYNYYTV